MATYLVLKIHVTLRRGKCSLLDICHEKGAQNLPESVPPTWNVSASRGREERDSLRLAIKSNANLLQLNRGKALVIRVQLTQRKKLKSASSRARKGARWSCGAAIRLRCDKNLSATFRATAVHPCVQTPDAQGLPETCMHALGSKVLGLTAPVADQAAQGWLVTGWR